MKTCSYPDCNRPVFSKGLCLYHQNKPPIKKKCKIKPVSEKRGRQNKAYKALCDEIDQELKNTKALFCFFCGKPLIESWDHHHLNGRDGDKLIDKVYLKVVHRNCHTKYHSWTTEKLQKEPWYEGFIERLDKIDPMLVEKELNKQLKASYQ